MSKNNSESKEVVKRTNKINVPDVINSTNKLVLAAELTEHINFILKNLQKTHPIHQNAIDHIKMIKIKNGDENGKNGKIKFNTEKELKDFRENLGEFAGGRSAESGPVIALYNAIDALSKNDFKRAENMVEVFKTQSEQIPRLYSNNNDLTKPARDKLIQKRSNLANTQQENAEKIKKYQNNIDNCEVEIALTKSQEPDLKLKLANDILNNIDVLLQDIVNPARPKQSVVGRINNALVGTKGITIPKAIVDLAQKVHSLRHKNGQISLNERQLEQFKRNIPEFEPGKSAESKAVMALYTSFQELTKEDLNKNSNNISDLKDSLEAFNELARETKRYKNKATPSFKAFDSIEKNAKGIETNQTLIKSYKDDIAELEKGNAEISVNYKKVNEKFEEVKGFENRNVYTPAKPKFKDGGYKPSSDPETFKQIKEYADNAVKYVKDTYHNVEHKIEDNYPEAKKTVTHITKNSVDAMKEMGEQISDFIHRDNAKDALNESLMQNDRKKKSSVRNVFESAKSLVVSAKNKITNFGKKNTSKSHSSQTMQSSEGGGKTWVEKVKKAGRTVKRGAKKTYNKIIGRH